MHEAHPGLKEAWDKYQELHNDPALVKAREQYHTLYKLLDNGTIRSDKSGADAILSSIRSRRKSS